LFHVTYNGVMFSTALLPSLAQQYPRLGMLFHEKGQDQILYNWPILAFCAAAALVPLIWLYRLPYQATREEQIGDARARQQHHPLSATASSTAE
jgi:hypothetical protein